MPEAVGARVVALLVLLAGLGAAGVAARAARERAERRAELELAELADHAATLAAVRLERYADPLAAAAAGHHLADTRSAPDEAFRRYVDALDLSAALSGLNALGIVERDGERLLLQHVEPSRPGAAPGDDLAIEPRYREAAARAARTGEPTLSAPVRGPDGAAARLALFAAQRREGAPITTEADRGRSVLRWTYAALSADDVVEAMGVASEEVALDVADADTGDVLYESGAGGAPVAQRILPVFGRRWTLTLHPRPALLARTRTAPPWSVGAVVAALALGAALAAHGWMRAAQRRGARLRAAERWRAAHASMQALVVIGPGGRPLAWNERAARLLSLHGEIELDRQLVLDDGRHLAELLARPAGTPPIDARLLPGAGQGMREASVEVLPLVPGAEAALCVRDVSAERAAARAAAERVAALEASASQAAAACSELLDLFDAVPYPIAFWDAQMVNRLANRAFRASLGGDRGPLVGQRLADVLGEEAFAHARPLAERALAGVVQTLERARTSPESGEVRYTLEHYLPHVVGGRTRGFYLLSHDVQELAESRHRLSTALRDHQALMRTLDAYMMVVETDRDGRVIDANHAFSRVSGFARAELVGQPMRAMGSGAHSPNFWRDMWTTISVGKPWSGEICNRTKDGRQYWVQTVIVPFAGADGRVDKYTSIMIDVTASKVIARELDRERERLDNILRGTHVGTWEWNVQTGEARYNERWAEMLGYRLDELEPHVDTWRQRVHPDDAGAMERALSRHLAGETDAYEHEVRLRRRDDTWIWVLDRGRVTTRTSGGEPEWVLGTHLDITARRHSEEVLRQAMTAAESASQAKTDFLANTSHEIRTPLNAIIGLSYLLDHTGLDGEQRAYVHKIQLAGSGLLALINDVLDLSKIEAGEMLLEAVAFDVRALCRDLHDVMASTANAKGLRLRVVGPSSPAVFMGDVTRVRQIVTNLLSNALKFTEAGEVELTVAIDDVSPEVARVQFRVRDTGIGIPEDVQRRLFMPFTQSDASTTRRFGGTGLGLSIVRRLVELMGGTVGFESRPGAGSTFWVSLDLRWGHVRPVERSHALPTEAATEPVGAATTAPWRAIGPGAPSAGAPAERPPLAGVRVLVIDDSDINLEVARRVLELAGASVDTGVNGVQAVDLLRGRPRDFDAVLMDVQMPVMDGKAATRQIKGELGLTSLPVIALTAGALSSERQRALDAGMCDFVSKPLDPRLLVRTVASHVARARGVPTADLLPEAWTPAVPSARSTAPMDPVAAAPPPGWPQIDGIDGVEVAERLGNDVDLFASILGHLLTSDHGLGATTTPGLAAALHRLKGSAGTLGARALHALAAAGEARARDASSVAAVGDVVRAVEEQLAQLTVAAGPFLEGARARTSARYDVADGTRPVALEELEGLLKLLLAQDLEAVERAQALSPNLVAAWGAARADALRAAIERLEFAEAAALVEAAALADRRPTTAL